MSWLSISGVLLIVTHLLLPLAFDDSALFSPTLRPPLSAKYMISMSKGVRSVTNLVL